jgi:hypothetical protein
MRRVMSGAAIGIVLVAAACSSKLEIDPLQLDRSQLTVDNRTDHDWTDVEIWINRQFRAKTPKILKGQRFQAPLNLFVSGFGQRFDFSRQQITDVRLNGKRPDGTPFELRKQFRSADPLVDALKGVGRTP